MDEDQPVENKTPLMEENEVLRYFQDHFTTNPKKLKKLALRMHPKVSPFIRRGIIYNILQAPDPVAYLRKCFVDMDAYTVIIKDLIEDGNHGMIIMGDVIHGIELETTITTDWLKNGASRWEPDQEIEIQHAVVKAFVTKNQIAHFHGKVVLFPAFGFSGMPREIEAKL